MQALNIHTIHTSRIELERKAFLGNLPSLKLALARAILLRKGYVGLDIRNNSFN